MIVRQCFAAAAIVGLAVFSPAPAAAPLSDRPMSAVHTSAAAAAPGSAFELTSQSGTGEPVRWPACRAIDYRINPAHEPKGMTAVVRRVMGIIGRQTGATFHYAGHTKHTFSSTTHASSPTIYVAFTGKRRASGQTFSWPGEIGVGGPAGAWYETASGGRYEAIVYGRVLLSTKFHGPRTGGGATWQSLIMHEVGHALNLAHRTPARDVMHASLTSGSPAKFAAPEVKALKRVLQTKGCDYVAWSRL